MFVESRLVASCDNSLRGIPLATGLAVTGRAFCQVRNYQDFLTTSGEYGNEALLLHTRRAATNQEEEIPRGKR